MRLTKEGQGARQSAAKDLILYVEDEPLNFRVAEVLLQDNFDLVHASDDRAACEALRRYNKRIYAILMDIQLVKSKLDGIELTRLIRGTLREADMPDYAVGVPVLSDVPIFFLTAYGSMYSESILQNAGGDRLLAKPVNAAVLELALTSIRLRKLGVPSLIPPKK
ncbi:MAG: response regulator [Myxococcales bacterium]|nr:response regulator [Myxococcales bacterium]